MDQVNGIILRTQDYGETNKIVTLLTEEYGMLSAVAKGAKKSKSRMAAVTQPFIYGQYVVYTGRGLGTIHQGETIQSMRHIREDLFKTAYATYMGELTTKILTERERNRPLFRELLESFERMEEDVPELAISLMYELKLYHVGGFAPVVNQCVNGHVNDPIAGFSVSEGGVVCEQCRHRATDVFVLSPNVYHVLRLMSNKSLTKIKDVSIKDDTLNTIKQILELYYDYYGGMRIKSKRFLDQLHLF
ncbi:DNA repair protein RecO (recombination protein O) [Alkalibacillus filiformis]|uniref:DNA repair protein RecO n=1 Tax=Alkalibacillus filiformis TaxID=200990 RepID=A0ABU0DRH8_9BACI|nr:DNA repair protein RecO [Alkalibacillus filiformis]MDQ0351052.1 DNA repair protein RecO (recombination protein O) [Alkalibacillus filiformis]